MTKARNIADLLDANGDVKSASLDNVPAVDLTNLSATNLTSGTIPNARITLDANEIPNISTDKLTSGTIPDARLPSTALNSNVDLATTLTTQGDLLFRDGSGLTRLAKGTHGQHLVQTGSHPAWTTPAVASSDYVKIGAQFINNVSYFDYNSVFSTTYKFHRIILQGMKTHSNSDKIVFQYRKANGTIRTSNYQWNFHDLRSMYNGSHENSKYYGHTSQSYIPLQHVTSRTTGNYESCYYDLTIMNHGNGSSTGNGAMYFNNIVYSGGAGAFCQIRGGGFNESMNNDNYDGFRLKTVGGNGFSGALTVYGIK